MNAETVDSLTAVEVKGSSPLGGGSLLSMVLLEVRVLLHTPSLFRYSVEEGRVALSR